VENRFQSLPFKRNLQRYAEGKTVAIGKVLKLKPYVPTTN
jgi:hypothetical protein